VGCYHTFNFQDDVIVIVEEKTEESVKFVHDGKKETMDRKLFDKNFTEIPPETPCEED
jgi:hypothetical protein